MEDIVEVERSDVNMINIPELKGKKLSDVTKIIEEMRETEVPCRYCHLNVVFTVLPAHEACCKEKEPYFD